MIDFWPKFVLRIGSNFLNTMHIQHKGITMYQLKKLLVTITTASADLQGNGLLCVCMYDLLIVEHIVYRQSTIH